MNQKKSAILPEELAVVVGAGLSGLAATKLLLALGAKVRLLERKPENAEKAKNDLAEYFSGGNLEIRCGEHQKEDFFGAKLVIPSPGAAAASIRPFLPKMNPPLIMAETELAWQQLEGETVLAVTGTSGKTTTTSLCAAMLQAQGFRVFTGGNIGTPLSIYVMDRRSGEPKADVIVLELSSFQLQTCQTLHAHVALLMNISENHLDFHKDMDEYISAKMRLFATQDENDIAVLHKGLENTIKSFPLKARKIWFGLPNAKESELFSGIQLLGKHNLENAEAAWLACRELGVSAEAAKKAVSNYHPLENRLELVGRHKGVLFVNDSKATTVEALRVSLNAFDGSILLLAGGKFKGGDLASLVPLMQQKVRHLALYGGAREYFESAFTGIVPLTWDATLEEAMRRLAQMAHSGDVILLAPATASFDQYASYICRGDDFKRIVPLVVPLLNQHQA